MGALQSLPGRRQYVDLAEKTGFSFEQIAVLHKRFKQLSHNEDTLLRDHFSQIPDLACNPIRSQITEAFFDRRNFRQNGEGTVEEIGFEEFLLVMSHFRPPSLHMMAEQREDVRRDKLRFLFNMHDTDNDGTITLEEYRHVVEELLSLSETLETATAKSIADAAMLEVASISMGHMVAKICIAAGPVQSSTLLCSHVGTPVCFSNLGACRPSSTEPDEFYEGITFEHFVKLLTGFEVETRMNVRFLNMDTTTLCK